MQLWCCTKKKEPINIDEVINYACSLTYNILMADVYGYSNNFIEYNGWYFKYKTSFTENYNMELIIEIKHSIDKITNSNTQEEEECVVCTETTNDFIVCCKQPTCKKCLKKIQKHNPENFCCPMCRKDLNSLTTKYTLTKEEVKKRV